MRLIELEVTSRYIGQEGHMRPGMRIRVDERRARMLIENGNARLVHYENKMAVPAENKEIPAKKSSGALTTGPSIATPSSSAPGSTTQSSSSPAAQASRRTRSKSAGRRGKKPED